MLPGLDRIKRFAAEEGQWAGPLIAVIGVLILTGGIITENPTETSTHYSNEEGFATEQTISVEVVEEDSELFEQGHVVEDNSLYLFSWNESANLKVTTVVPENANIRTHSYIRYTVTETNENNIVYQEEVHLNESTNVGGDIEEISVNIYEIVEKRNSIQSNFGNAAITSVDIVTETKYQSESYEGSYETISSFTQVGELGYQIPTSEEMVTERTEEQVTQVDSLITIGNTHIGKSQFLLIFVGSSLVFVGVLVLFGKKRIDAEYIHGKVLENRYTKYIVPVEDSQFRVDRARKTDCLEGLIDLAINSDRSVIKDKSSLNYYVKTEDDVYYYPVHIDNQEPPKDRCRNELTEE